MLGALAWMGGMFANAFKLPPAAMEEARRVRAACEAWDSVINLPKGEALDAIPALLNKYDAELREAYAAGVSKNEGGTVPTIGRRSREWDKYGATLRDRRRLFGEQAEASDDFATDPVTEADMAASKKKRSNLTLLKELVRRIEGGEFEIDELKTFTDASWNNQRIFEVTVSAGKGIPTDDEVMFGNGKKEPPKAATPFGARDLDID